MCRVLGRSTRITGGCAREDARGAAERLRHEQAGTQFCSELHTEHDSFWGSGSAVRVDGGAWYSLNSDQSAVTRALLPRSRILDFVAAFNPYDAHLIVKADPHGPIFSLGVPLRHQSSDPKSHLVVDAYLARR